MSSVPLVDVTTDDHTTVISTYSLSTQPTLEVLSSRDRLLYDINDWLKVKYSLFLIIVGTVLNILSVLTLSRKSFRRSTTSVYLRFLAIMDMFVLYNGLGRHFISGALNYNIRHSNEAFCKVNQWSTSFGPDISAWVLVAVTAERVLSIVHPHTVKSICSRLTAAMVIVSISIVLLAANLPLLLFYGNLKVYDETTNTTLIFKCVIVEAVDFMEGIWYWLDLIKFVLLPSALLITFNIIILASVARSRKRVRRLTSQTNTAFTKESSSRDPDDPDLKGVEGRNIDDGGSKGLRTNVNESKEELNSQKVRGQVYHISDGRLANYAGKSSKNRLTGGSKEKSLKITLVAINATFVVCNTPVMVFLLNRLGWFEPHQRAESALAWTCVVQAMYTNNALNFLLYCATGSRFRSEMRAMFVPCVAACRRLRSRGRRADDSRMSNTDRRFENISSNSTHISNEA